MHEMQPIVTDVHGICLSVRPSHGSTQLHCAKVDEQIKMLFWVDTLGGQWDCVTRES